MASSKYSSLPSSECSDFSNDHEHEDEKEKDELMTVLQSEQVRRKFELIGWRTIATISFLNIAMLALSLGLFLYSRASNGDPELRQVSTWSPLLELVDLKFYSTKINGSLFPSSPSPAFTRQFPNPEADSVWDEWELTRIFPITKETVLRLGKNPETAVKLDAATFGFQEDMYAAHLDVYHQLHCLNTLRQIAFGRYYNESQVEADIYDSTINEVHINHCVDMLAQALQCSGNLDIYTVHWAKNFRSPMPDFSIEKKCIDFDKLTEWRKENTVDLETYDRVTKKPTGQIEEPDPVPAWWPGHF